MDEAEEIGVRGAMVALGLGTPLKRAFVVGIVVGIIAFTAGLPKSAFTDAGELRYMRTSVTLGNLRRGAFLAATSLATCRASSDLSACAAAADAPKTTSLSWFYNKPVRLRIALVRHGESALPGRFDRGMGSPQALAMCLAVPGSLSVTR